MSLRLRLALAIAAIAGLVAAGIGVVVYDRERADRLDRARRAVAADVRIFARLIDEDNLAPEGAIIETPATGGRAPQVPRALRLRLVDGDVYSVLTRGRGTPFVIAGTRLRTGGRVYARASFAADDLALRELRLVLVQVGVGAAAIGALLGLAVSILLGRPLRRSAALARRLAAGDLDARLNPRGHDEIAQLGRALDEMAAALGAKIAALDESAERERRFSSDVAHELRTPVTGLVAAAALLDDTAPARMVRERAGALAALVEDLLEVMRLESARELPRLDEFDLVRLVHDVVATRAPGVAVGGVPSCAVVSDPRRIERILGNLLDNAVRHGRPPITVTVDEHAAVTVRDHGDGFGRFLDHAGERFAIAAPERGAGTGLGLAIARGQARVLGGELDLHDDGGAVATLRLGPARPVPDTDIQGPVAPTVAADA
jgi:signal transduction histidine kinase